MPHVAPKKLKKEVLQKLYAEFSEAMETSAKKSHVKLFLGSLLTKTEKIMLAKRFAVIFLLSKGVPVMYIAESLGMSPATIHRMSLKFEIGNYSSLLRSIEKEKKDLWKILERIIRAGLPPRAGRGRWKFLYTETKN